MEDMLPAIMRIEIPLFAKYNEKVLYRLGDRGIYLTNNDGVEIHAKAGTEILKMWRVK